MRQCFDFYDCLKSTLLDESMHPKKKYFFCILIFLFLFALILSFGSLCASRKKVGSTFTSSHSNSIISVRNNTNHYIPTSILTSKLSLLAGNFIAYVSRSSNQAEVKYSSYQIFLSPPNFIFSKDLPIVDGNVDVASARMDRNLLKINAVKEAVAEFISRRYRLPYQPIQHLVDAAFETGRLSGIDPLLLLAVMAIESTFNSEAVSKAGAKGLMQVMPYVHSDKFEYFGGVSVVFDPYANMQVGTRILKDCLKKRGSLKAALRCYVGAKKNNDGGYAKKVIAVRKLFRAAARKKY